MRMSYCPQAGQAGPRRPGRLTTSAVGSALRPSPSPRRRRRPRPCPTPTATCRSSSAALRAAKLIHLTDVQGIRDRDGRLLAKHRKVNVLGELMDPPYTPGAGAGGQPGTVTPQPTRRPVPLQ